jgi:hypothetical protein
LQHPDQQQGQGQPQRKSKQSPAKRCFDRREGWILHDSTFSLAISRRTQLFFTIGCKQRDEMQKQQKAFQPMVCSNETLLQKDFQQVSGSSRLWGIDRIVPQFTRRSFSW